MRRFNLRNTVLAVGWVAAADEFEMNVGTGTSATDTKTLTTAGESWAWTTPATYPNVADWPAASVNEPYRAVINVTAMGSAVSLSTASGVCVSSDGASNLQSWSMPWDSTTGTGLKTASNTSVNPTAGSASDRFGVQVPVATSNTMMDNSITISGLNTSGTYAEGPWAANIDQPGFRGYNDDGTLGTSGTATTKGAINANWSQAVDENFRVRIALDLLSDGSCHPFSVEYALYYSHNGGAWTRVSGASSVVRSSASPHVTQGASLPAQEDLGGVGTSELGSFDEANGQALGPAVEPDERTQLEFCLQIRSVDVANSDTVALRLHRINGDAFASYTNVPTLTVQEGPIDRLPPYARVALQAVNRAATY